MNTYCSAISKSLWAVAAYHTHVTTPPIPAGSLECAGDAIAMHIKEICGRDAYPIVFMNYWPAMHIMRAIRRHVPDAKIIQVVHDLPWLTLFAGDADAFFDSYSSAFADKPEHARKFLKYSTYDTLIALRDADHVICLCDDTFDILSINYQIPAEKLHIIPNGITDFYTSSPYAANNLKDASTAASDSCMVLFVGRPSESKGWDRTVQLARHIKTSGITAKIICIGDNRFAEFIPTDLSDVFIDKGTVPHKSMHALYRECDYVFVPSRHEQCSYTIIEAMMHGKDIVAYGGYGISNMIDASCAHIIHSADEFPFGRKDKGVLARRRYEDKFTIERMTRSYLSLLSQL